MLLGSGANIEARHHDGWTPLMVAAFYGHEQVVELLLHGKADVGAHRQDGRTSLHLATSSGQETVVQLLLGSRANIEAHQHDGVTQLTVAALSHVHPMQALVDHRAQVNVRNAFGQTPSDSVDGLAHRQALQLLFTALW